MTRISLTLLILLLAISNGIPLFAQTAEIVDLVTQPAIDKVKAQIEADTTLDAEVAAKALEQLKAASEVLTLTEGMKSKEAQFAAQVAKIDGEQADKKTKLDSAQALTAEKLDHLSDKVINKMLLEELQELLTGLEQELAEKQRNVVESQAELTKAETSIEERTSRIKTIKERLAQIPADVARVEVELTKLDSSTNPPVVIESNRLYLEAQKRQLQQEPALLQSELSWMEATASAKLFQAEQRIQTFRLAIFKEEVETWTKKIGEVRTKIARNRKVQSLALMEEAENDVVKELFKKNAEIVQAELDVTNKIEDYQSQVESVINQRAKLEEDYQQLQKREERVGFSKSFGIRLRQQRNALPRIASIESEIQSRIPLIEDIQLKYLKYRDDRQELDTSKDLMTEAPPIQRGGVLDNEEQIEFSRRQERQNELVKIAYQHRRDYLDEIIGAYENYIDAVDTFEAEQKSLIVLTKEYAKYIDEKVLWIRSHEALTPSLVLDDSESLKKLADRESWQRIFQFYSNDAAKSPIPYVIIVLLWVSLLATQPYQKASLRACGKQAASRLNTSLTPTNRAILWTFIKSLVLPLPLLFLYYRAYVGKTPPEILVLTRHLLLVAVGVFGFEFIRTTCRPFGLGDKHFAWSERVNQLISLQISSFLTLVTPVAVVIAILRSRSNEGDLDSMERICSVTIFILAAYMLHRITSPQSGITSEWADSHSESWGSQFTPVLYFVSIAIPLGLAGLTIAGFSYASQQIAARLAETFALVFCVLFLRAYLTRWLTLGQRRRAIKQARELRAQLEKTNDSSTLSDSLPDRSNLAEIGEQTRRLLNTILIILTVFGVWLIWENIIPALKFFDNWTLPGSGIAITALMMAAIFAGITISAARNVPGLLEVLLLEKLPFDRSARYAIKAVTQYLIVLLGVLSCFQAVNIGWDQVQWLAAALTFGLGFGLQEIFANFVSGLIILFEQPVRVGDVVTIDNVTGVVNRIRIRSTTITDWDRKEYIVPNKEFITGRLLNWTLSDTITRLTIDVGVAYGSNVDQVMQVLNDVASKCEDILKDPPHVITFRAFGESSLDFTLRVFLATLDKRLEVTNTLHTEIYKALESANIEIPFPQRDLHLRSITDLIKPEEILKELQNSSDENSLAT